MRRRTLITLMAATALSGCFGPSELQTAADASAAAVARLGGYDAVTFDEASGDPATTVFLTGVRATAGPRSYAIRRISVDAPTAVPGEGWRADALRLEGVDAGASGQAESLIFNSPTVSPAGVAGHASLQAIGLTHAPGRYGMSLGLQSAEVLPDGDAVLLRLSGAVLGDSGTLLGGGLEISARFGPSLPDGTVSIGGIRIAAGESRLEGRVDLGELPAGTLQAFFRGLLDPTAGGDFSAFAQAHLVGAELAYTDRGGIRDVLSRTGRLADGPDASPDLADLDAAIGDRALTRHLARRVDLALKTPSEVRLTLSPPATLRLSRLGDVLASRSAGGILGIDVNSRPRRR